MREKILKCGRIINSYGREQLIANMVMAVVVVFWGISFISIKIAVTEIPPTTMALIRFTTASLLLRIILQHIEPGATIRKSDLPKMILGGILGITLYFYFENMGVKLSTAANASLIVTIIPIIAIGLDVIVFHSKISVLKLLGVGIAIVGTYLSVTANGRIDFNSTNFKGNMFVVCAMLSWAFYTLVNKSLHKKYSGICLTTYQTVFGTLCLVPLSLLEYKEWRLFSLVSFWHVLFLAVCCSVGCYVLYIYVLKRLDVAITTLYLNLVPVVGVVGGYLVLNERVLPIQLIGGWITIFAILVVNVDRIIQERKLHHEHCNSD